MINWFLELSNADRISFVALIISTISLLLSLSNLIILFISKFKKLEINLVSYRIVKLKDFYFHQFQIQILNKSQLPISIKSISCNDIFSPKMPHLVKESNHTNSAGIKESIKTMTFPFPINLSSLEGTSGYLEFKSISKIELSALYLDVFTNRGKISKVKVDTSHAVKDTSYNPYTV